MSQLERQREERAGQKRAKAAGKEKPRLRSYELTKADREFLKNNEFSDGEVLEAVQTAVDKGLLLSVRADSATGASFAIARETGVAWDRARAISVWASNGARALTALAYYLSIINPTFPDLPKTAEADELY